MEDKTQLKVGLIKQFYCRNTSFANQMVLRTNLSTYQLLLRESWFFKGYNVY